MDVICCHHKADVDAKPSLKAGCGKCPLSIFGTTCFYSHVRDVIQDCDPNDVANILTKEVDIPDDDVFHINKEEKSK